MSLNEDERKTMVGLQMEGRKGDWNFSAHCTFAMSLMILLVLICSTKVSEKSDTAKS